MHVCVYRCAYVYMHMSMKTSKIPTIKFKQKLIFELFPTLLGVAYIFMAWAWAMYVFFLSLCLYIYFIACEVYSHDF